MAVLVCALCINIYTIYGDTQCKPHKNIGDSALKYRTSGSKHPRQVVLLRGKWLHYTELLKKGL